MVRYFSPERRKRHSEDRSRRYDDDRERSKKSRRRSRSRSRERERDRYSSDRRREDRSRDRERNRERDDRRHRDKDGDRKYAPAVKPNKLEEIRVKEEPIPWNEFPAPKPQEANSGKAAEEEPVEKEKPSLKPSGKLLEDTNMVNGVVVKYVESPEAKVPKVMWQLHPFRNLEGKDPEPLPVMHIFKVEEEEFGIVDPRLSMKGPGRGRRSTFKFVKEGEYQKQAHIQRNTARLHLLQSEIETVAKQTGISTAVKLALVTPDVDQGTSNYLPSTEWWDEHVLQKKSYDAIPTVDLPPEQRYSATITRLIEHPILLKAPDEPVVPTMLKVYLTKKERKKLRRQNRREILKEEAEKVRLGLKPPPEPKVKTGNLMKVLGTDAIQDPTKMEAHVREQMAARMKKHLKANAERKLTKEERSDKKKRKIAEDTSLNVNVSIYRIKSLAHPSKKFKAETNAKQLAMTGVMVIYKDINLIVVEGGPKQQKFYKNLMLNRIKWSEEIVGQEKKKKAIVDDDDEEDDDENAPKNYNECQLVWEGIVRNRAFNDFRVQMLQSPKQVREFLEKHGVSHYWDHAYSTSVLLSEEPE